MAESIALHATNNRPTTAIMFRLGRVAKSHGSYMLYRILAMIFFPASLPQGGTSLEYLTAWTAIPGLYIVESKK
jgi:hypothetical protein